MLRYLALVQSNKDISGLKTCSVKKKNTFVNKIAFMVTVTNTEGILICIERTCHFIY
jgi:hypothetical protein